MYKLLITTSGTGSRLGKLTAYTNKSLLELKSRKIIDNILEVYDPKIPLVITLGYYGDKVKQYLARKYITRSITFVVVDPYTGPKSSLAYSMLAAKEYLQCPFIFHCNDTIVKDKIPSPEKNNWDGVWKKTGKTFNTFSYSSVLIKNGLITKLQPKGAKTADALHIGLVGIKDYKVFWGKLSKIYKQNSLDQTLNDCSAISAMIEKGIDFYPFFVKNWFDTGNTYTLTNAQKKLQLVNSF